MINTVALSFTADFQSEYEPIHLLLGLTIGIIGIIIIAKKIIHRKNKK